MNDTALAPADKALVPSSSMTPMDMLAYAVERNAGIDVLEKLMALQERWERNEARKAFDAAMANAKAELPVVVKNRTADFPHKDGKGRTSYQYEDLGEIARTIDPILAKNGLSYRFSATSNANEPITVTCIISHRDGHCERTTLSSGRDDSGSKNAIQSIGSAITFLQRYTLKVALGLAASADDDGAATGIGDALDAQQVEWLQSCIVKVGADIGRFLNYMSRLAKVPIERVEDIPARLYPQALDALNKKRADDAKKAGAQ